MTCFAVPVATTRPRSSQTARSQICATAFMSCETSRIVVPRARSCSKCAKHLRWKRTSPTESASSTTRIAGSHASAVEKQSRACMPLE